MYFFWLIRKNVDSRSLKQSILTSQYHFGISFPSLASLAGIRSTFISFGKMKRYRVLKVHFYFHYRLLSTCRRRSSDANRNIALRDSNERSVSHLHKYIEAAFKLASRILEWRDSGSSLEILELSLRNRYKLYFRMTRLRNKFSLSTDVWYLSSLSRYIRITQ